MGELQNRRIAALQARIERAQSVERELAARYRAAFAAGTTDRRALLDRINTTMENIEALTRECEQAVWRRDRALGERIVESW